MNHDEESGKISKVTSMILALPKSLKSMENKSNLNFQHIMSTCDTTVSVIEHNQSLCADLTESHVVRSVEFYLDESICALNDPCNTSYTNKLHLV